MLAHDNKRNMSIRDCFFFVFCLFVWHHIGWDAMQLSWLGVGLVISRSLVQFPAGALWSVLGQDSLFHIASVYPAAKWVPSINKAVLRACVLYAANCSGISLGRLKWCPCVQAC